MGFYLVCFTCIGRFSLHTSLTGKLKKNSHSSEYDWKIIYKGWQIMKNLRLGHQQFLTDNSFFFACTRFPLCKRRYQTCETFVLFLQIWYFQLSLGFRQKFNRVKLIHDFRVKCGEKTHDVFNNLIYGMSKDNVRVQDVWRWIIMYTVKDVQFFFIFRSWVLWT